MRIFINQKTEQQHMQQQQQRQQKQNKKLNKNKQTNKTIYRKNSQHACHAEKRSSTPIKQKT